MHIVHSMMGCDGGPAKTGRAKTIVAARGQMSLGHLFLLRAAIMHVMNAIAALNGTRRIIEKSIRSSYQSICHLSTHKRPSAAGGCAPKTGQAAIAAIAPEPEILFPTP